MDANTPPTEERGSKEGLRFKDLYRPFKEAPSYPVARADWHPSNIWATTPHFKVNHDEYDLVPLPLGYVAEAEDILPQQPVIESKPVIEAEAPATKPDQLTITVNKIVHRLLQPVRKAFLDERRRLNTEIAGLVDSLAKRDARIDELSQSLAVVKTNLNRLRSATFSRKGS